MSNIFEHQANGEDFLMWNAPIDARSFKIFNDEQPYLSYFLGTETPRIYLPSGTYTILGLGSELSEEQKVMIVDGQFDTFLDYESPSAGGFIFDTAHDSVESLCTSKGMQLKNTLFIKKEK